MKRTKAMHATTRMQSLRGEKIYAQGKPALPWHAP